MLATCNSSLYDYRSLVPNLQLHVLCILFNPVQVEDASTIKNSDIAKELSLPPVKLHCSSESNPILLVFLFLTMSCDNQE